MRTFAEPSVDFKFTSMAQFVKAHHEELSAFNGKAGSPAVFENRTI